MDIFVDKIQPFFRIHRFEQEFTKNRQKYYFTVNRRKLKVHFITSLLLLIISALGVTLLLLAGFTNPYRKFLLDREILLVAVRFTIISLCVIFLTALTYFILLLVKNSQLKKLQKFSLTLEEGMMSVCEKSVSISENLTMRIVFDVGILFGPLATTKLIFEPQNLSAFSEFSKVEKYLTYLEKRKLAEQLSSKLNIQLTDMFSSFEPGIYKHKQNFILKPKFVQFKSSGNLKLEETQDSWNIRLPLHRKKAFMVIFFLQWVLIILFYVLFFYLFWSTLRVFGAYLFVISTPLIFPFLTILMYSEDEIRVANDSITLTRRYIAGKRKVFYSQLSELKDIAIIHVKKNARIVFRNDEQIKLTRENSKEAITKATLAINKLLVSRF